MWELRRERSRKSWSGPLSAPANTARHLRRPGGARGAGGGAARAPPTGRARPWPRGPRGPRRAIRPSRARRDGPDERDERQDDHDRDQEGADEEEGERPGVVPQVHEEERDQG